LFKDRAEHAAAKARRTLTDVALMFLDLNGFKAVNDRLGHAAGDKLLVEITRRLQQIAAPPTLSPASAATNSRSFSVRSATDTLSKRPHSA
jgi:GGDEF domain-containing protein